MAQIIISDAEVKLANVKGGGALVGVKSVEVNYTPAILDNTAMGATAKSRIIGLQDWSIDIEIFQDYLDADIDEDLAQIMGLFAGGVGTGNVGAIDIGPTGAGPSANNPHYESTAGLLENYSPVAAATVGELGVVKLRIVAMAANLVRTIA